MISGEPRSATVYAIRDSQLARLSAARFEQLLEQHPKATFQMVTSRLVARLGNRSNQATAADVHLYSRGGRGRTRCARVGFCQHGWPASLAQLGSVAHLTSALVDRDLGRPGIAHAFDREDWSTQLVEWLAEQEVDHRFVVYESDAGLTPWTERTIRQADHVVVVADATADPQPGEIETELLGSERRHGAAAYVGPRATRTGAPRRPRARAGCPDARWIATCTCASIDRTTSIVWRAC